MERSILLHGIGRTNDFGNPIGKVSISREYGTPDISYAAGISDGESILPACSITYNIWCILLSVPHMGLINIGNLREQYEGCDLQLYGFKPVAGSQNEGLLKVDIPDGHHTMRVSTVGSCHVPGQLIETTTQFQTNKVQTNLLRELLIKGADPQELIGQFRSTEFQVETEYLNPEISADLKAFASLLGL